MVDPMWLCPDTAVLGVNCGLSIRFGHMSCVKNLPRGRDLSRLVEKWCSSQEIKLSIELQILLVISAKHQALLKSGTVVEDSPASSGLGFCLPSAKTLSLAHHTQETSNSAAAVYKAELQRSFSSTSQIFTYASNSRCLREGTMIFVLSSGCTNSLTGRIHSRGGASGNKLKMTLGLPVYVEITKLTLRLSRCGDSVYTIN